MSCHAVRCSGSPGYALRCKINHEKREKCLEVNIEQLLTLLSQLDKQEGVYFYFNTVPCMFYYFVL
jgi:hypothetical protein